MPLTVCQCFRGIFKRVKGRMKIFIIPYSFNSFVCNGILPENSKILESEQKITTQSCLKLRITKSDNKTKTTSLRTQMPYKDMWSLKNEFVV